MEENGSISGGRSALLRNRQKEGLVNSRFRMIRIGLRDRWRSGVQVLVIAITAGVSFGQQTSTPFRAVNQLPLGLVGRPLSAFVTSLGTRLEVTGLERTKLGGVISRPGSADLPIVVTPEYPGRIRIVEGIGSAQVVSVVDEQLQKATSGMSPAQLKLVEILLFDCQEFCCSTTPTSEGRVYWARHLHTQERPPQSDFRSSITARMFVCLSRGLSVQSVST
jgi:hypothetical protein